MAFRARFKNRTVFYHKSKLARDAYGAKRSLSKPDLGKEGLPRFVADEKIDLRARDRIDLMESMRSPRERDFYQDHTYHDQWEERPHNERQMMEIRSRYAFFDPNYQIKPWIWYPGDIVEVVEGPSAGQRGSIIAVVPYRNQIIVQNINVQDVTIPAGDGRPEQVVQREHPIQARTTRHVDPSNGQLCELKIITVKAKNEDGSQKYDEDGLELTEERRISMSTGTILPIPPRTNTNTVETGDPLRDTPYQDAVETTYEPEKEMAVLVERKLAALEEHFVKTLRRAHATHARLDEANAAEMFSFQRSAIDNAMKKVASSLNESASSLDDWWFEELAPLVQDIEERKQQKLREQLEREEAKLAASAEGKEMLRKQQSDEDEADEEDEEDLDDDDVGHDDDVRDLSSGEEERAPSSSK